MAAMTVTMTMTGPRSAGAPAGIRATGPPALPGDPVVEDWLDPEPLTASEQVELAAFLASLHGRLGRALARRRGALADLHKIGFGKVRVELHLHAGKWHLSSVEVGTTATE